MDDRLGAALRDLAGAIAFPPTPDLRSAVAERLRAPVRRGWWPVAWPRAIVLAVLATLLVVATAAALVLVLPGLRITIVPEVPSPGPSALATRLALGEPTPVATLDVSIPEALGAPDEAYRSPDGDVVSLVYHVRGDLPELAPGSGIGLLLQEIDGTLDRERVQKLVGEVGATVIALNVAGMPGFWIEGRPHEVRYTDASGAERAEMTRLVGDTLVWERGGVLYRIESGLGRDATVRIAESLDQ
jgi:hypothetical protein